MKTFNLRDMANEAESNKGDFVPEDNAFYPEATVKHASWRVDKNGKPSWYVIVDTPDGSFPVPLNFGSMSFANKRVFDSIRAVGYTDFDNLDPEVVCAMFKTAKVAVKVKWGKNKTNPDDPWANHYFLPVQRDIPEPEMDDDDDY